MEKINNIEITNFKSIKHLEINDCNKINVFIGMPNAGKSNVLEALGLFGFDSLKKDKLNDFIRFQSDFELFYRGILKEKILISLNKNITLNIQVQSQQPEIKHFKIYGSELKYYYNHAIQSELVRDVKKYIFSNRQQKRGSYALEIPYGENIGQIVSDNLLLRKQISEYLKTNGFKLVVKSGTYELAIQEELKDGTIFELPYNSIADTLQRLIFYKAAIMSNKDAVLLFEEPEAHCFEPYILEFTNAVKYDENDNQYFIVTHSDFIIQEFLRDEESKVNTNIYLVNNVDGETKLKLLSKDKNDDVYEFGMNPFFNFENLWESN